jgi:hypothetical protein
MSLDLQYSRWTGALKQAGCPSCRIMKGEAWKYMITLVREGKSHDEVYIRIQRAWGFCERHARMLKEIGPAKLGDGMSPTRLCSWLLGVLSMRLSKGERSTRTASPPKHKMAQWIMRKVLPGEGIAKHTEAKGPCPACEDLSRYERSLLWGLQRFLSPTRGDETIRRMYQGSDALCLPHLRLALEEVEEEASAVLLLQVQEQALARLSGNLKEYLRKHDYRYSHEPMSEAEGNSYLRATALFVGER